MSFTKLSVGHLPAEIVHIIYDMILKSKYQGYEDPWDQVFEQDRFSIMISASGIAYDPHNEIVSRQGSRCLSLQPATETTESEPLDYSQAMDFDIAPAEEDWRYQDSTRNHTLDGDITKDMSPDPSSADGIERPQSRSEEVSQGMKRRHSSSARDDSFQSRKRAWGQIETGSPERIS